VQLETIAAPLVNLALTEDIGAGDVTTRAVVSEHARARAQIIAREAGTLAGLAVVQMAFRQLDPQVDFRPQRADGDRLAANSVVCVIDGLAHAILSAERVALNFLGRLSGIATETARYVEAIRSTGARVRDTRKTTPVLRLLEKYAVTVGGGDNHRHGLYDMVLFKENHLQAAGSITAAVAAARRQAPAVPIEVEATTLAEAEEAAAAGVDWILLDNMQPAEVRDVVARLRPAAADSATGAVAGAASTDATAPAAGGRRRPAIEASGRIDLTNARDYAATGIDAISVGAITHSARALDFTLLFESVSDLA
jgi:nicotinate-nucleotide pyrophosphorylase (carboxylating)